MTDDLNRKNLTSTKKST